MVFRSGGVAAAVNNTFRNVGANAINVLPSQALTVTNNVFAGTGGKSLYSEGTITSDHNLFAPGATFFGTNSGSTPISADPQFISATDPHLRTTSPGVDKGVAAAVYTTFQTRYGISIAVDREGNSRLVPFDIGAYEVVAPPPPAVQVRFYTVAPCRLVDTRSSATGGPALAAHETRAFSVIGACNIPASAKAISANVTTTSGTVAGYLSVYPSGLPTPVSSTVNYRAGQTRANSVVLLIGNGGNLTVLCGQASGSSHVILDVNGYYQ
jgi:hypothetical protein